MSQARPIAVEVFSDPICPWCYIGKRRLQRALSETAPQESAPPASGADRLRGGDSFDDAGQLRGGVVSDGADRLRGGVGIRIHWRAFMLNPDMAREGMARDTYLALKFGHPRRAAELMAALERAGREEGIAFALDAIRRTPSTLAAQRLIALAGRQGCQEAVVEGLFRAYFSRGIDIGDGDNLLAVAQAAGMERRPTAAFLASGEGADQVRAEHARARRLGIDAVPCFLLDGRYAVSGAQPPALLARMIETARHAATV